MYDKTSRKIFTILYPITAFEPWQAERLPMLCDSSWCRNEDEGVYELSVYERSVRGIVNGVRKNWGIEPRAIVRVIRGQVALYPIPQ